MTRASEDPSARCGSCERLIHGCPDCPSDDRRDAPPTTCNRCGKPADYHAPAADVYWCAPCALEAQLSPIVLKKVVGSR